MKKITIVLSVSFLLLSLSTVVNATLITIGSAGYDSDGSGIIDNDENYNLIWDDDNNGNSVVWLDYSNHKDTWGNQMSWANGLSIALTLNLYTTYSVIWEDTEWRLSAAVDGPLIHGYDGSTATWGENITSSEMGHLYYIELHNKSDHDTDGEVQSNPGLKNTGPFKYLLEEWYWTNTEQSYYGPPTSAWDFMMGDGGTARNGTGIIPIGDYGLAIRTGTVTYTAPVPEPSTILIFGLGLLGLAGVSRKKTDAHGR